MVECESVLFLKMIFHQVRFNRYMVECELEQGGTRYSGSNVLIDTWWNVNLKDKNAIVDGL